MIGRLLVNGVIATLGRTPSESANARNGVVPKGKIDASRNGLRSDETWTS